MAGAQFASNEDLTVSSTSVGLTATTYIGCNYARITAESHAVRFTFAGTAPTSTTGEYLEVGDTMILDSDSQLASIRFIRRDGTDATLHCNYGVKN